MSDVSIKAWVQVENENYDDFKDFAASKIEGACCRTISEVLYNQLKNSDTAQVTMPWGTYFAARKNDGTEAGVDISWEPSKGFLKLLNESSDNNDKAENYDRNYQDEFDPEFVKLFTDYLAYGKFYPTDDEKADESNHGILLDDAEVTYFLNSYTLALYNVAKEKYRDGKVYRLEIDYEYPHGAFDFSYKGDKIDVKFTPNKVFKQALKDDKAHDLAAKGDFKPMTEVTKILEPAS